MVLEVLDVVVVVVEVVVVDVVDVVEDVVVVPSTGTEVVVDDVVVSGAVNRPITKVMVEPLSTSSPAERLCSKTTSMRGSLGSSTSTSRSSPVRSRSDGAPT